MNTFKNWAKAIFMLTTIPCIMTGAIAVGIALRLAGVKIEQNKEQH